jgi:hypothetical protein
MCELAEKLGLTVSELLHGRGTPMSLQEATVIWPAYWAYQNREQERQLKEAEREQEKAASRGGRR